MGQEGLHLVLSRMDKAGSRGVQLHASIVQSLTLRMLSLPGLAVDDDHDVLCAA